MLESEAGPAGGVDFDHARNPQSRSTEDDPRCCAICHALGGFSVFEARKPAITHFHLSKILATETIRV